jgi:hypothetical protein
MQVGHALGGHEVKGGLVVVVVGGGVVVLGIVTVMASITVGGAVE